MNDRDVTDNATPTEAAPTFGEDRSQLFNRIRAALDRPEGGRPESVAPPVDESIIRLANMSDDLTTLFTQHAQAVGMKVTQLKRDTLTTTIRNLIQEWDVRRVGVSVNNTELRGAVDSVVLEANLENADWRNAADFEALFESDLGITDVEAALADSGSLVLRSGPNQSRGAYLLPPIHLAIVNASQILPDMIDYWPRFKKAESDSPAAATVFITGPSKTADIEGILITGVHGPGEVHILLIEDA